MVLVGVDKLEKNEGLGLVLSNVARFSRFYDDYLLLYANGMGVIEIFTCLFLSFSFSISGLCARAYASGHINHQQGRNL